MEIQEIINKSSRNGAHRYRFYNWVAPALFFIWTVLMTLSQGSAMAGEDYLTLSSLIRGIPFALTTMVIIGAHSAGHYITARRHGVSAYLPYFLPGFGLYGTAGAYTKMQWPIRDRNSLIRIFTVGPIAGFCASWLLFLIGLHMSQIVEVKATETSVTLGDSLITLLTDRLVFGRMPENKDVFLHPVAYAGWLGLYWNCWHLLPMGKFDGGRILYGLYGVKTTKLISYSTFVALFGLGFLWDGWFALAILGALFMINSRNQYPTDNYTDNIQKTNIALSVLALVILIVSFAPIPFHIKGI
jgi:membrane-associated protease RseP (regulator of RpoE activity)